MSFEVWTVVVVLAIFSVFLWAALKAEKVVSAKAREKRAADQKVLAAKGGLKPAVKK